MSSPPNSSISPPPDSQTLLSHNPLPQFSKNSCSSKTTEAPYQQHRPSLTGAAPISLRHTLHSGHLPLLLQLSSSSLSSPHPPPAIPVLAPRCSYLHVCCADALSSLAKFAVQSFEGAWFSEQSSEEDCQKCPLRWTIPVGVLFDIRSKPTTGLPWILDIHFIRYPHTVLPPLSSSLTEVRRSHLHALKQSLYILHGNASVALTGLTRSVSESLFESLRKGDGEGHARVLRSMLTPTDGRGIRSIPVRMYVIFDDNENGQVLQCLQRPVYPNFEEVGKRTKSMTLGRLVDDWIGGDEDSVKKPSVTVQGAKVPLQVPLENLWGWMHHPDLFLYVIVRFGRVNL